MLLYNNPRHAVPVAVNLVRVTQEKAYLRTTVDEELQALVLTEGQVSQERNIHIGHLPAGHFMLAQRDTGEVPLDIVELAGLLSLAHPLGELAHADVETDGSVGGIAGAGEVGVVLHCFSGSKEFLKDCLNEGYYISLGGVTTFKNAVKPKEIAKIVPLDRLFLETDAPYMTPVPHRGTTNYPYYIPIIAEQIAELKGITVEEVAKVTTENAIKFFNLG